ncbi:MFS transporter [Herbaspirillum sp. HC18]|nr:MFS transporter [Herbaspirillum sp. HC18]
MPHSPADPSLIDSRHAAWRLAAALFAATLGNSGMYVLSVVLPTVQREFGIDRASASLPYTMAMIGFGLGGILCGRLADRHGIARVLVLGAAGVSSGYILAGLSPNILLFGLAHGLLLGLLGIGSAFVPLIADTSLWWNKRRGIAVAVCASGNYLAGAIWPPLAQWGIEHYGWRPTYTTLGLVCGAGMLLMSFRLRQRPPLPVAAAAVPGGAASHTSERPFGLGLGQAQLALFLAGIGCCVAMSMPQVHIVAYCTDLGFGAARGAEMLSLMLACGIVSRLTSGWISDRIGGLRTLILGSTLQGIALLLFLPFDGLVSLYLISALFGLFQGGIVPSYAIIVREYFPPKEAGARVGTVIFGTLIGMALGGWMSGKVFDLTGSYHAAFINGIAWNLFNLGIVLWLFRRSRIRRVERHPAQAAALDS